VAKFQEFECHTARILCGKVGRSYLNFAKEVSLIDVLAGNSGKLKLPSVPLADVHSRPRIDRKG
jgi:hypothetical protein